MAAAAAARVAAAAWKAGATVPATAATAMVKEEAAKAGVARVVAKVVARVVAARAAVVWAAAKVGVARVAAVEPAETERAALAEGTAGRAGPHYPQGYGCSTSTHTES